MKHFLSIPFIRSVSNPGAGCILGDYGIYDVCVICPRKEVCEGVKDAYEAPLQSLPLYITSKHPVVRHVAQVRFIELQEKPPPKRLVKDLLKPPLRFLRNFFPTSHKI